MYMGESSGPAQALAQLDSTSTRSSDSYQSHMHARSDPAMSYRIGFPIHSYTRVC